MKVTLIRKFAIVVAAIALTASAGASRAADTAPAQQTAALDSNATPDNAEQAAKGKALYHSLPCVRCHGSNCVQNSSAAYDLRTFPHDDKTRFVNSVTKGKNNRMPPWGDVLKPEEIDQLWAYIQTVGKQ